jgi:branched-chain amino acid transport system substrate-binding protein
METVVLCEAIQRAAADGALAKGGLSEELRKADRKSFLGAVKFDEKGDNPEFSPPWRSIRTARS